MSRRPPSEFDVGSDSFMDVIANMVGIMIILIVIVGIRVAHAPIERPADAASPSAETRAIEAAPRALAGPQLPDLPWNGPVPSDLPIRDAQSEPPAQAAGSDSDPAAHELSAAAAPELDEADFESAAALAAQRAVLEAERAQLAEESAARRARRAALDQELSLVDAAAVSLTRDLADAGTRRIVENDLMQASSEVDAARDRLAALREELLRLRNRPRTSQVVVHKVAPVGQTVQAEELHFRVLNNRVVPVPIKPLVQRALAGANKHKDWIARARQYQGEVGPIDGFSMTYVLRGEPLADGIVRVSMDSFRIDDEHPVEETLEQAVQTDSAFARALRSAPDNATLTFWVYPDSYKTFRELQRAAHQAGFTVAARPLPFGVPVAGSSSGTRSVGQ